MIKTVQINYTYQIYIICRLSNLREIYALVWYLLSKVSVKIYACFVFKVKPPTSQTQKWVKLAFFHVFCYQSCEIMPTL